MFNCPINVEEPENQKTKHKYHHHVCNSLDHITLPGCVTPSPTTVLLSFLTKNTAQTYDY